MALTTHGAKLKILFVTTEEAPFAKVGGLGEVMYSLPRALVELGHDARVIIPAYDSIIQNEKVISLIQEDIGVPTMPENKGERISCNVSMYERNGDPRSPATTYFLENQEYYGSRSNVYGYKDDALRFVLLCRGTLEFLAESDWMPDVVVSTDWMTGFLPNLLKTDYKEYRQFKKLSTVLSIHNLESQGPLRHHRFIPESERDDGHGSLPAFSDPRLEHVNAMRRGILYADAINTVSPRYAEEIMTEEFGEELDGLLREKRGQLFGILNGIDYEKNDPADDPLLARTFSPQKLQLRAENKAALQKRFGLELEEKIFVMGIVSRLTPQKGFDLLEPVIGDFLALSGAQLIVLGEGDPEIMSFFSELEEKYPRQVRAHLKFDADLPHLIFAGADVTLVPSHFEPSGLIQMEAMHYGAIPIAHGIGGLADTIDDFSPETGKGTGFLFREPNATALLIAIVRAYEDWQHKRVWPKIQRTAMEKDFSWLRSAKEYEKLFKISIAVRKKSRKKTPPSEFYPEFKYE